MKTNQVEVVKIHEVVLCADDAEVISNLIGAGECRAIQAQPAKRWRSRWTPQPGAMPEDNERPRNSCGRCLRDPQIVLRLC